MYTDLLSPPPRWLAEADGAPDEGVAEEVSAGRSLWEVRQAAELALVILMEDTSGPTPRADLGMMG
jgi:hypothetical protein